MNPPDKLSPHFTLAELTRSQAAARRGLDNTPDQSATANLLLLCVELLEPIRAALGVVEISSGFRSSKVNVAVGGSRYSQHVAGVAADFIVRGRSVQEVFDYLRQTDLPFDQLIDEFDAWVHISYDAAGGRRQVLRARHANGKTTYTPVTA